MIASSPLLVVGNGDPVHVGRHLMVGAATLGIDAVLCDSRDAFDAPTWQRRFNWWVRGHRPSALEPFSRRVVETAHQRGCRSILATGLAPISAKALQRLGQRGVQRLNFLTDDPWASSHHAPWFLKALPHYDHIFTPRTANIGELRRLGGPAVSYLPFAFAPDVHCPDASLTVSDRERYQADLMFAGGADRDRIAALVPFVDAGFNVRLYGGYWDQDARTAPAANGFLDGAGLRKAVAAAKVCLCLVRRANRDGHSMRSFELPAMGACILVEDSDDHRDLFGPDGEAVVYFSTPEQGVAQLRQLLTDPDRRTAMAARARAAIARGHHAYADRLQAMLGRVRAAEVA
jgi:spore maturation protein CgeB